MDPKNITKIKFIVDNFEDSIIYEGNVTFPSSTELIIKEQSINEVFFLMNEFLKLNNKIIFEIENNIL